MQNNTADALKQLRTQRGYSKPSFAKKFNIPYSTYYDWELGRRTPPEYVLSMMSDILKMEDKIRQQTNLIEKMQNRHKESKRIFDALKKEYGDTYD